MFDDGVVMFLFLCSFSLLYLTHNLECFEVRKICLSFLMVHFVEIDVFAFVGFVSHICMVLSSFNFPVRPFN